MKFYAWLCSFFADSRKVLYLSLGIGVFFVLLHVIFCIDIYDDVASCYAWTAREIGRGNWNKGFHPWLPPLIPYAAGLLGFCGIEAFTATIIVSGLFYVLTAIPVYFMTKELLGYKYAGWGAFAYILTPKIIRLGCSGMPNSGRNLFLILSLALIFSFFKKRSWWKLVLTGVSIAGLGLARGEGIVYVPFFALIFIIMYFIRRDDHPITLGYIGGMLLRGLVIITVMLAALSPRLIQMYNRTGYAVLDGRQVGRWEELVSRFDHTPKTIRGKENEEEKIVPPSTSFVKQYFNSKHIKKFINAFVRGAYELYFIMAIIGIIIIIRKKQWKPEYYVLIVFSLINAMIFFFVTLSYRYFLINAPLFLPFTLKGFELVWLILNDQRLEKYKARYAFPAAVAVLALAQSWNGVAKLTDVDKFYYEKAVSDWAVRNTPANRRGKLAILSEQPQYPFWADAKHIMFDRNKSIWTKTVDEADYDYIILENKHSEKIEEIRKHKNIVEVPQEWAKKVTVFRKK